MEILSTQPGFKVRIDSFSKYQLTYKHIVKNKLCLKLKLVFEFR